MPYNGYSGYNATDNPAQRGSGGGGLPSWLPYAVAGAETLGGLFTGLNASKNSKAQIAEQQREFNISQAGGPTRALEGLPLRDRLLHILMSRFGNNPTTYANAQASYTPGSGGTQQSGDIYREMLRRMGYNVPATTVPGAGTPAATPAPAPRNPLQAPGWWGSR